jgi:hypothetical protein
MKLILLFGCLALSTLGYAQIAAVKNARMDSLSKAAREERDRQFAKDSSKRNVQIEHARRLRTDSLIAVMQSTLNITKEKATTVMQIVNQSVTAMDVNAKDRAIAGEEKISRFKAIAKDRDDKIAALLSEEQIKTLREIMLHSRQQVTGAAAAPPPPPATWQ